MFLGTHRNSKRFVQQKGEKKGDHFIFPLFPPLTLICLSKSPLYCISELMLNYRYVVYDTIHLYFTYKIKQLTPPRILLIKKKKVGTNT